MDVVVIPAKLKKTNKEGYNNSAVGGTRSFFRNAGTK